MTRLLTTIVILSFTTVIRTVSAQAADIVARPVSLGAGLVWSDSPVRGAEDRVIPFPVIVYEGERFFLRGPRIGIRLLNEGNWSAEAAIRAEFEGWDADDDPFLAGMEDRSETAEIGIEIERTLRGKFILGAGFWHDLLNEHGGYEITVGAGYRLIMRRTFILTPDASVRFFSEEKADYYYGVHLQEALPGRPAYQPGASFIFDLGISFLYRFNPEWSLLFRPSLEFLSSDLRDSPIVEDDVVPGAILTVTRRF